MWSRDCGDFGDWPLAPASAASHPRIQALERPTVAAKVRDIDARLEPTRPLTGLFVALDVLESKVIARLARYSRVTYHFTLTSASWLNAGEGSFAALTRRCLKRGVFVGIVDLQAAIYRYAADHNFYPKRFRWRANPRQDHRRSTRAPDVRFNPLAWRYATPITAQRDGVCIIGRCQTRKSMEP